MKTIICVVISFFAAACGSPNRQDGSSTSIDTTKDTVTVKEPADSETGKEPADTLLWVGVFAQWNHSSAVVFDGNYDTANQIFKVCGENSAQVVERDRVVLLPRGNCDTAFGDRIRMYKKIRDSFSFVGSGPRLIDISSMKPKVEIKIGDRIKTIYLKNQEVQRIRRISPMLNRRTLQEKAAAVDTTR